MLIKVPSLQAVVAAASPSTPVLLLDASPAFPTSLALFFEGDQIVDDAAREDLGSELLEHSSHLRAMQAKLPCAFVAGVLPSRVTPDGFAAYDNLLCGTTLTGEPLGYQPKGYRASRHLADIVSAAGRAHQRQLQQQGEEQRGELGSVQGAGDLLGLPCTLLGFSKSGTVLNQVLAEMAGHEAARQAAAATASQSPYIEGAAPLRVTDAGMSAPDAGPASVLLDSITDVHYVDAGLNGRGVHLTDARLVASLGARHRRLPLHVHFHGTPRQWLDRRRPWIAKEKDLSVSLLREAQVPVAERLYFAGSPPSLKQHFEIIGALQLLA